MVANNKTEVVSRSRSKTPPVVNLEMTKTNNTNTNKRRSTDMNADTVSGGGTSMGGVWHQWKGRRDFVAAQGQVVLILLLAYLGNTWPHSYPRNENHDLSMFWCMNGTILVAAVVTMKHVESKQGIVTLLSRGQTEEWKGGMQWAFIMYHYYRAYPVYNEIRVFVSAYVWMTGFGNFLYFDKRGDYSIQRCVGMWLRINYFPCLLSLVLRVPLDLYYVVPLHTAGFFIALFTSLIGTKLDRWRHRQEQQQQQQLEATIIRHPFLTTKLLRTKWHCNAVAIVLCCIVHVLFYETPVVNCLLMISKEIHFRFQADKYSVLIGIISGFFWKDFSAILQRLHGENDNNNNNNNNDDEEQQQLLLPSNDITTEKSSDTTSTTTTTKTIDEKIKARQTRAIWIQRIGGAALIALWYVLFGSIGDKYKYNPVHPYIFWIPMAGYLMIRNSSKYLTECHSTVLEWLGRITLETYVLQFHVFMTQNVQHILVVLPGAGSDGNIVMKTLNMLLCGLCFVLLSYWARKVTVSTQMTVTELVTLLKNR